MNYKEGQNYYNQPALWADVAEYQKNVLNDILHFIPDDVTSILDVGCGNGFVINALAGNYACAGVDIRRTALESVRVENKLGTADALPFPDASFDLLMINDVLEHLPDATLRKALAELQRVSGKYILVTVPFLENLRAGMTCCAHCGTVYHITRHVRSFGVKELRGLFGEALPPERLIYSGSEHDIRDLYQYEIRAKLHLHTSWDKAACPVCGEKASVNPSATLDTTPYYTGIAELAKDPLFLPPLRNGCIALFRKEGRPADLPDSAITLVVDGQKTKAHFALENGNSFLLTGANGEYCYLEFTANGVIHTYPRPTPLPGRGFRIPAWFNNAITGYDSKVLHEAILDQYLLLRHSLTETENTRMQGKFLNLTEELQEQKEYLAPIINNFKRSWPGWRSNIENLAAPNLKGRPADDGKPHFLVITHDQKLDRRIVQQVEALIRVGWSGVVVALSFDSEDHLEEKTGYFIHRVGQKHIVPDCRCYWLYQRGLYLSRRWFKFLPQSISATLCNLAYHALCRLHYRCPSINHPLPFNLAFFLAGRNYPAELIIAEDLPALKAAALLKRQWGCRLLFDSHEFYPEQRIFSSTQKRIMHQITRNYIHDCDQVSTVSHGIAALFQQYYDIKKPIVLHNVTKVENIERGHKFHQLLNLDAGQKVILYQGGIIPDRNIENLLAGFVRLNPVNTHLVFLGPTAPKFQEELKQMAGALLNRKVHFLEEVPQAELLGYTASADFGVIPYRVIDLNTKFCMPNKFFEFIQAGLPILSNELIEVEKILRQIGGGGMIANLNSPKQVAEALSKMLARELERDHQVLCQARSVLSWEHEAEYFLELIRKITAENNPKGE